MSSAHRAVVTVAVAALTLAPAGAEVEPPAATELLAATIRYHDPAGAWMDGRFRLELRTDYADGRVSDRIAVIDNRSGDYQQHRKADGRHVEQELVGDTCRFRVDGSDATSEQRTELELTCESLKTWRDYHGFLWGLPMKMRDPGATLDPAVHAREFQGQDVWALQIHYEESVGTEVWYLYIDRTSHRMAGYEFFKDGGSGKGEYIVLQGELEAEGFRIPRSRSWFLSANDEPLGTDTLLSLVRE